jgi:stage V sporulation protein G
MDITDVRVYLQNGGRSLKAFASVTLDGEFAVRDLKVVDGKKGLFVSMPSRKRTDGTYQDLAFPVTKELRETLHGRVLDAYRRAREET